MMKNDKKYTFAYITTCKGRLEHLKVTLPIVVAQAGTDIEVIVVDYGCPDNAGDWVNKLYPNVKVIRVNDDPGFNVSRARNFGARNTQANWLGFFDADMIIDHDFLSAVIPTLKQGHFYVSNDKDLNKYGSCVVRRDNFESIGGYDETFEGYGGEDLDLYEMLILRGIRRDCYLGNKISAIRHSHEIRMTFYKNKNIPRSIHVNNLYKSIKLDIIRLTKKQPTHLECKKIRAQIIDKLVETTQKKLASKSELTMLIMERLPEFPTLKEIDGKIVQPKIKVYLSYVLDYN